MIAPRPAWLLLATVPGLLSGRAWAQASPCRLCDPAVVADAPVRRPLAVVVRGSVEFGRLAQRGASGGSAGLNPDGSTAGTDGGLTDLGGARWAAEVRLTGEPGTRVRVDWPDRLALRSADGGVVTLTGIRSDGPRVVRLDSAGTARFGLGARLEVPAGAAGAFRGRIPIEAEYE